MDANKQNSILTNLVGSLFITVLDKSSEVVYKYKHR
jgi:hypothetical protein